MLRKISSAFDKLDDNGNFTVLEQSIVANGFTITEFIDPMTPEVKLAFQNSRNFWIGIFFLILMVIPCSAIAPLTVFLPAKHPLVRQTWRTQG